MSPFDLVESQLRPRRRIFFKKLMTRLAGKALKRLRHTPENEFNAVFYFTIALFNIPTSIAKSGSPSPPSRPSRPPKDPNSPNIWGPYLRLRIDCLCPRALSRGSRPRCSTPTRFYRTPHGARRQERLALIPPWATSRTGCGEAWTAGATTGSQYPSLGSTQALVTEVLFSVLFASKN